MVNKDIERNKQSVLSENTLEISICKSDHSRPGSGEVGIKIHDKHTGITVYSRTEKTQYANKIAALKKLELRLNKEGGV